MNDDDGKISWDPIPCSYCDQLVPGPDVTRDHLVPKHTGGKLTPENRVLCCYVCNQLKGGKRFYRISDAKIYIAWRRWKLGFAPTAISRDDFTEHVAQHRKNGNGSINKSNSDFGAFTPTPLEPLSVSLLELNLHRNKRTEK